MEQRKVIFGLLIVLGFAMVSTLYLLVMSDTADVSGTVQIESRLVSWRDAPPGIEDKEMVSANGYCVKGPDSKNRRLLSTKNKNKIGEVKYSFVAQEGMRHLIVIYLQLDHLTGAVGQNMELQFITDPIKKHDLKCDFAIVFDEKNGVQMIRITVTGENKDTPMLFEYPLAEIPKTIKL